MDRLEELLGIALGCVAGDRLAGAADGGGDGDLAPGKDLLDLIGRVTAIATYAGEVIDGADVDVPRILTDDTAGADGTDVDLIVGIVGREEVDADPIGELPLGGLECLVSLSGYDGAGLRQLLHQALGGDGLLVGLHLLLHPLVKLCEQLLGRRVGESVLLHRHDGDEEILSRLLGDHLCQLLIDRLYVDHLSHLLSEHRLGLDTGDVSSLGEVSGVLDSVLLVGPILFLLDSIVVVSEDLLDHATVLSLSEAVLAGASQLGGQSLEGTGVLALLGDHIGLEGVLRLCDDEGSGADRGL